MLCFIVRDVMEYMGFAISYDDDQDWYEFLRFFSISVTLVRGDVDYVVADSV